MARSDEEMSEYSCWHGQSEDGTGMPAHAGASPSRHTLSLSQTNSTAMMDGASESGAPHPWPAPSGASGPSAAYVPKNQRKMLQKNMMGAVAEFAIDTPEQSPGHSGDDSEAARSAASEKRAYDENGDRFCGL